MAFSIAMHGVSFVTDYDSAVRFYKACTPWRGSDADGERPLKGKRTRDMGVSVVGEDVCFRFHNTTVVTWHPDGSCTLNPYTSRSTCIFADRFTPSRVYLNKGGTVLQVDDTLYPVGSGPIRIAADRTVSGGVGVFVKPTINRKRANALLATTRYKEYRRWFAAMYPMLQDIPPKWSRRAYTWETTLAYLSDDAMWHDLMLNWDGRPDTIRDKLYTYKGPLAGIYDTEKVTRLSCYTNLARWEVRPF